MYLQVRKTMARIKFVLNERRLALLDAQESAAAGTLWDAEATIEGDEAADLFEEGAGPTDKVLADANIQRSQG